MSEVASLRDETLQAIKQLHEALERWLYGADSAHTLTRNEMLKVLEYVKLAAEVVNKG